MFSIIRNYTQKLFLEPSSKRSRSSVDFMVSQTSVLCSVDMFASYSDKLDAIERYMRGLTAQVISSDGDFTPCRSYR